MKIKVRENSKPITVSYITDLEKRFPDNELLKEKEPESVIPCTFCALQVRLSVIVVLLHCIYSWQCIY